MEWLKRFNIIAECRVLRWGLWRCPPFLFLVMGAVTIISMVATYVIASRTIEEPQVAALIVIAVTILLLLFGNAIIAGFNRVAEASRMKSEFISLVSHQLRSPLSIFKWTVDLLEREFHSGRIVSSDRDSKNGFIGFLTTLHETTERMIRLVNSLLEASRIEARTFVLRKEAVSMQELTKAVLGEYGKYAAASGTKLLFEADAQLPTVEADRDRIAMVMHNLIDNAVRYAPGSGDVRIKIKTENDFLHWSIEDRGVGIPSAQQKYIFQKFFRAGNVKTGNSAGQTQGTGVGLYIAKAIVEASGGKIGFASEERKGSTFWFTLPIQSKV